MNDELSSLDLAARALLLSRLMMCLVAGIFAVVAVWMLITYGVWVSWAWAGPSWQIFHATYFFLLVGWVIYSKAMKNHMTQCGNPASYIHSFYWLAFGVGITLVWLEIFPLHPQLTDGFGVLRPSRWLPVLLAWLVSLGQLIP